jgi:predicted type IV restriction endonuclease
MKGNMELPSQTSQEAFNTTSELLKRIASVPEASLVSEEDVKNKVVLPMLRALGYDDADFNYERRTGRGYVDVIVENFQTGIIVEAKAPRTKLDNHLTQLETYVFHKHSPDRATVAILTDGHLFHIYGITGPLWKGSLESHEFFTFRRSELGEPSVVLQLTDLLGKKNNQTGMIINAIATYKSKSRDRIGQIEAELGRLGVERERIDARIKELEQERTSIAQRTPIPGYAPSYRGGSKATGLLSELVSAQSSVGNFPAIPHILRLLKERKAFSKAHAVDRKWLDQQLVNKFEGISNHQVVSFGLIELKKVGQIKYDGKPVKEVWLTQDSG